MDRHAYLIMAHNEFHMLKKLLNELDVERNDIYIHIDKKTKYVNTDEIASWVMKSKVFFVPRKRVYWGTLSMVKCELALLKAAVKGNYRYYHLISGVDFPLKSQDSIHEYLDDKDSEFIEYHENGARGDFFLDKLKFYYPIIRFVGKGPFEGPGKKKMLMRNLLKFQWYVVEFQKKHNVDRTKRYKSAVLYKGNQWFTITHELALYILSQKTKINRLFRLANGPDEMVVPILAMNSAFRDRVVNKSLRLIDWDRGNPYEFCLNDFKELTDSDAFFARKISYNNQPALVDSLIEFLHKENKQNKKPLISIIVPCYNVENYLSECVDSLVNQSYRNTEILLIDDGSTDKTADIAQKYAAEYENVKYFYRENGGLSAARNSGIELAKGEYLAFVDSDDWLDLQYVEKMYAALSNSHADISMCGYQKEETEHEKVSFDKDVVLSSHAVMRILGDIYPKENVLSVIACNKLFKRELFDVERFKEGIIHEDEFMAHRIIGKATSVAVITDALYHYRIRAGSITTSDRSQNLKRLDYLKALKDRLEYCHSMFYGDLVIYMLYTYFEGMKQLMATYSDEAMEKNHLYRFFRKEACSIYFKYFGELDGYQKKDYMKLIFFPGKYRENVIRLLNSEN